MAKSQVNKQLVYTILCDVLFQVLILFLTLTAWLLTQWGTSRDMAAKIPGLNRQISDQKSSIASLQSASEDKDALITRLATQERDRGHQFQALVREKKDLADANAGLTQQMTALVHERDVLSGNTSTLQQMIGNLTSENATLRSRLKAGHPVTVVVLIDVTASMQEPIVALRSSMAALFEFMPNTSEDFRVGILAFRRGVVASFPITRIRPQYEDGGKSQDDVLKFLGSLRAEQGHTEHASVFQKAMQMLKDAHPQHNPQRKERLMLLGDVGPSELDQQPGYTSTERAIKDKLVEELTVWVKTGDRGVVSLYAESDFTKQDAAAKENREWFHTLGNVSPQSAFYTDTSELMRAILHASLN